MRGVAYGRVLEKETMIGAVEDFVIDFKNPNNGGVYILYIYIYDAHTITLLIQNVTDW